MKTIGLIFVSCVAALKGETFVVTSIADEGAGSLREAISLANGTAAIDLIVFSGGEEGSINFSDGVPRVIQIASTLSVTQSLEIVGPGKTLLAIGEGTEIFSLNRERFVSFPLQVLLSQNLIASPILPFEMARLSSEVRISEFSEVWS